MSVSSCNIAQELFGEYHEKRKASRVKRYERVLRSAPAANPLNSARRTETASLGSWARSRRQSVLLCSSAVHLIL